MATDQTFADFIVDQAGDAGAIFARKMFGEYALYCSGKVVALMCDNRLFVKPTRAGREFMGLVEETPPYQGAKPYFLVNDRLDDREWLGRLLRLTAEELPEPKKKKSKA